MSRELKISITLLILLGITFGILAYLNIMVNQKDTDFEGTIVSDAEFKEVVAQLDTSEKLIDYLNRYFTIEDRGGDKAYVPEEFFEKKKGEPWDSAVFISYILFKNKYESAIMRYKYKDQTEKEGINAAVVFRDGDIPKTIIFTSSGAEIYAHGWSFEDMFQKEEERLNIGIQEYSISYWTDAGELWPEEWFKRE